jgi:hypothetical protein
VLQLNFTKFDLELSPNCEFDFLQVGIANKIWYQCFVLNFMTFPVLRVCDSECKIDTV